MSFVLTTHPSTVLGAHARPTCVQPVHSHQLSRAPKSVGVQAENRAWVETMRKSPKFELIIRGSRATLLRWILQVIILI